MISNKFIKAVKLNERRAYRIAQKAGIHPSTLSKILNGIIQVNVGDARVVAIGRVLGIKESELFENRRGQL